jgi:hypothetical protein
MYASKQLEFLASWSHFTATKLSSPLARVLEEDEDGRVRDAAYGALLRLAAAPEAAPTELH